MEPRWNGPEEGATLVIDIGSSTMRLGIAGEPTPEFCIPTVMGMFPSFFCSGSNTGRQAASYRWNVCWRS